MILIGFFIAFDELMIGINWVLIGKLLMSMGGWFGGSGHFLFVRKLLLIKSKKLWDFCDWLRLNGFIFLKIRGVMSWITIEDILDILALEGDEESTDDNGNKMIKHWLFVLMTVLFVLIFSIFEE